MSIACTIAELNLDVCLICGQSFRWTKNASGNWIGAFANRVWILSQEPDHIKFQINYKEAPEGLAKSVLADYFKLDVKLAPLYKTWSESDPKFSAVAKQLPGVRILRQDPVECLFSFICSSNNNIARISSMVDKLCTLYGEFICEYEGKSFHSFPTVNRLASNGVESTLRQSGFGYRARFIAQSARQLDELGVAEWLLSLREQSYIEARDQLMTLFGVGRKVADCVCLMSLDKHDVIPVDTHVWQLAGQYDVPCCRDSKKLNPGNYDGINHFFRELWGEYCGWAHSVVFSSELSRFKKRTEKNSFHGRKRKRSS